MLAHYANRSLPAHAAMPECGSAGWKCHGRATGDFFTARYPLHAWFRGAFWEKPVTYPRKGVDPGAHAAVTASVARQYGGQLFGLFRSPSRRALSAYAYQNRRSDGRLGRQMGLLSYATRIRGMVTKMLAGQESGDDCRRAESRCDAARRGGAPRWQMVWRPTGARRARANVRKKESTHFTFR